VKKNQLNQLEFFKNQPVWFGFDFISLKLKKPNRTQTRKKPSQTRTGKNRVKQKKNRAKPNQTRIGWFEPAFFQITKPKPVGLNRFRFGFGFLKKKPVWLLFL
jgi:hypothetical protein